MTRAAGTAAPSTTTAPGGRVADAIVRALIEADVEVVFGIPGVHTLALYDALARAGRPRHVLVRHEQAAAFAADGYGRISSRPGVCLATTGPGVFNTIAALSEAYADSSPVVVLAGQVPVDAIGRERGLLHEVADQAAAFEPVTKAVWRPRSAAAVVDAVAEALAAAPAGRPRPVYVELPFDLVSAPAVAPTSRDELTERPATRAEPAGSADGDALAAASRLLARARRPVILAGGGVNRSRANAELQALAERLDAPVVMSVNGLGSIPAGHPLAAGTLLRRTVGSRALVEDHADLVLVVGCRLDANTTADWTLRFPPLIHIDTDPHVIGLNHAPEVAVLRDARSALRILLTALGPTSADRRPEGADRVREAHDRLARSLGPTAPPELDAMLALRRSVPDETILAMDATLMSGWASAFWPVHRPAGLLFPFGGATLGFALPAAIGGSLASPGSPVIAMLGDSGLLFSLAELATVREEQLPIVTVVFNNRSLGSIREAQLDEYGAAFAADWQVPDFVALGRAFDLPAERVDDLAAMPAVIARAVATGRPHLVEVTAPFRSPWSYILGQSG